MSKLASFEPCMSRGSILSVPEGVLFASPNGLVLIANGQAQLITDGLIQRDEWNNYNRIATLRATRMSNAYYAFGSERKGFMQTDTFQTNAFQQDDFFGSFRGILLDPTNQRISFNLLTSDLITTNIFNDAWSGETLIIRSGKIYRLDMADREFARDVALWKSKIFQATDKKNFAAMRVYFEIPPWATSFVDSYTKLLLHFDGAGGATSFIDECGHTFTAAGNAQIDTADSKIGGASLLLDGVGDWVTTADTDDWAIGANDFTIECWFKCNAAGGTQLMIAGQCDSAATVTSRSFNIYRETTNVMAAGVFVGTTAYNCSGTIQFTNAVNTGWHHIALVRIGNVLKMFIDGAQDGGDVAITGTVNNSPNALRIGALGEYVSQPWIGWIDEFRFSIGKARWTTNFTPSTAPYTLVVPLNPVRNTSENQTLQSDQYGIVRVYADNRLVMTRELRTSGELMRLPAGFKADYWQIEFETRVRINSVQLATSVKELLKA
jgi:hypothetical protein